MEDDFLHESFLETCDPADVRRVLFYLAYRLVGRVWRRWERLQQRYADSEAPDPNANPGGNDATVYRSEI